MATRRPKRPRDPVELGKLIGDILTGQIEDKPQATRPPVDDLATVDGDELVLLVTRRLKETRAMAVYFMHYNFVRIHKTLKVTPAMAAGVTPKLWEMADMVKVLEDWEAEQAAD
jgi:hypothetical protein